TRARGPLVDRGKVGRLVQQLHAARVGGRLEEVWAVFADEVHFGIAGTSDGKPIAVGARGIGEIRSWLAMMLKTFKLNRREELCSMIDGARSAVHWRADIHSRITGAVVSTELFDLIEVRAGRILSYT